MIYSRAYKYAVQALLYLASKPVDYHTVDEIAKERDIPKHFLAKILKDLAKGDLLESRKGRGGGFKLANPPEDIELLKVVEIIDGLGSIYSCVFGIDQCDDDNPCPLHDQWIKVRTQIVDFLKQNTVADLVKE